MLFKSNHRNVAIVGMNRESVELMQILLDNGSAHIVRVLNNEYEDLSDLKKIHDLDLIIHTSNDPQVIGRIRALGLRNVEIIGGLSARILFMSGKQSGSVETLSFDRNRILTSLSEIKQAVLLSKNKEELLKLFLHVAMGSCSADAGSIMLLDSQKRYLKIEMSDGLTGEIVKSTVQRIGKGIAGKVARNGKPLLINGNVQNDDAVVSKRESTISSAICCPLVIGEEVVGVLNIASRDANRVFGKSDLAYVKELADFTADVIKTSNEYDATQNANFSLTLIGSIQQILSLDFPFEERLNLILMKLGNSLSATICNYYQYDYESGLFLAHASNSFNVDILKGKRIKLNDTIARDVLNHRDTVVLVLPNSTDGSQKWYIAQPIYVGKRLTGLLFVHIVSAKKDIHEEKRIVGRVGELLAQDLSSSMERRVLRMQSAKLSAISEASFNIATARTLKELVNFSLPNVCLILEAEAAVFWLLNPVSDQLELYSSFTIDNQGRLKEIERIDSLMLPKQVPSDSVLIIEDLVNSGYVRGDDGPRSLLSKSFGRGTTVAAVLSLYGKKSIDLFGSNSFTENDKEVFLKFCLQFSKGLAQLMPFFDEKR